MAEHRLKLQPWLVPNFAFAQMPPHLRQEGIGGNPKFALAELDADILAQMCDDFRAEVFRKAGKPDPAAPAEGGT